MLEVGQKAIDFSLPDELGNIHNLSDYLGKKIVLYFYPKDNTLGCTNQALEFKRLYEDFKELNTIIIGISKDSIKSHLNFKNKYDFPFILLSDESLDVINKYGVYGKKVMYGKESMGVIRTTFIIDENFIVKNIERKVNSKKNPEDTLCIIKSI